MAHCVNRTTLEDAGDDAGMSSVINRVFLPAVCIFGVVGNTLNLAVLTRRKLQKSFRTLEQAANLCLICLAVSDLMFCFFAFLTVFQPSDNIYDGAGFLLVYGLYNVAIINVFIMESTLLTVAMSLERYLAICFPLRQDIYLTTRRIKFVIFFTVVFSVCFNIPVVWRNEAVMICANGSHDPISDVNVLRRNMTSLEDDSNPDENSQLLQDMNLLAILNVTQTVAGMVNNGSFSSTTNILRTNKTLLRIAPSFLSSTQQSSEHSIHPPPLLLSPALSSLSTFPSTSKSSSVKIDTLSSNSKTFYTTRIVLLGGSHVYDTTYRIVWAFVGNFIPLVLLFYFNVCLCRQIYRSYKLRRELGRQNLARSSSNVLTITLVAIVVLFFILVAPSEVTLQVSHMTSRGDTPFYKNIEAVLNLMQSINFSVNFILYCIISPHFRRTFKHMILCGCCVSRHSTRDLTIKFQTSFM